MLFGYSYLLLYTFGEVNLKLKKAFLFQLFVIFFITIFCTLGTWQLYRLQWKLELISEITLVLDSSPIEYSNSIKKNYQRVNAKGKFDFDKQIYLYSLNDSGKPGYDVVTPFRTNKNQNVLRSKQNEHVMNESLDQYDWIKNNEIIEKALSLTLFSDTTTHFPDFVLDLWSLSIIASSLQTSHQFSAMPIRRMK